LLAVFLAGLLIMEGSSGQILGLRNTPNTISSPTPTSPLMIKVLSYNILFGAGVDRKYDDLLLPKLRNRNRLPELISFITAVNPDILGIQEANGWDTGTPSVIRQVARQLDMNYYLAKAPNDFHVVLLTKFKIVSIENLSGEEGDINFETMRALRATLLTPDEQSLNVFIVHFDPFSTRIRLHQVDALIHELEPYNEQTTILLGDMNFCVGSPEYKIVEQAGWQPIAVATDIDQLWISPAAKWTSKPLSMLGNFALHLRDLSDHLPVGAEISIYSTSASAPIFTSFPYTHRYAPGPDC
jgi:endonuclease/exonuclease/phosphatase family metal-dependent hydrolase